MINKISHSACDTVKLGELFAKTLKGKDVMILEGVLGAGKTTFVKGILGGFGKRVRVLSPSFTLVRRYNKNNMSIYHIDLYRIEKESIFDFGIEDYLYAPGAVALIEWGEKIEEYLSRYIKVNFSFTGENSRKISFSFKGYPRQSSALLNKSLAS